MSEQQRSGQLTMDDLLDAGRRCGAQPTRRMVQDWVELGLLDQPQRHGRGRARGVSATWSPQQLRLFETLLDKRTTVKHVAPLCNVPVWLWLYFGDDFVPLRQVRRALVTWQGRTINTSWQAAKRAAAQLLDLAAVRARRSDMRLLVERTASLIRRSPRQFDERDETELREILAGMHGAGRSAIVRTLGGMEFEPDAYLTLLKARLGAAGALQDDSIDDALFHWARFSNVMTKAEYQTHLARMTGRPGAAFATVPSGEGTLSRACLDLVTLLGFGLDMPGGAVAQSLDHPAVWRMRNLRSVVHGEEHGNAVRVRVEVQEAPVEPEPPA